MTGPTTVNDADDASLTGKSYSGYAVISGEANDVYNEVLSGEDANFTFEAVSYTHLDVYKRQIQTGPLQ